MTILTRYAVEPSRIILGWFHVVAGKETVATVRSEELARRIALLLNGDPQERPQAQRPGEGEEVADGG